MMVPHAIKYFRTDVRNILQQFMSDHRMALHDDILLRSKTPRLVENGERNLGFPDVVQRGRHSQPLDVEVDKSDFERKSDRDARYQEAVLEGSLMISSNVIQPGADPVALDAGNDVRGDILGLRKVDRLAMLDCGEHRSEGFRTVHGFGSDGFGIFSRGFCRGFDLRQLGSDLTGAANHRS